MKRLAFFFRQGLSNLNHNRQRTLFVLFSIAVGVAAIVSLRTLGLMIGDSLTRNLQAENRGDIVVNVPVFSIASGGEYDETLVEPGEDLFETDAFSAEGIARMRAWAEENGYEFSVASRTGNPVRVRPEGKGAQSEIAFTFFVEPERYPFYGTTEFVEPKNMTLTQALAEPDQVVISERLAEALGVGVGDKLRLVGPDPFLVSAIMNDGAESSLRDVNTLLMPYVYLRYEVGVEQLGRKADTVYLKLPPGSDLQAVREAFQESFRGLGILTTEDLRKQYSTLSENLTKLITTMGLVSLLIGGIGIINTMLVVVGRRTTEIGVLKTIGLQGYQITLMFLVEALLLGLLGSIAGVFLGLMLVTALQGVAERVFEQTLQFALYAQALVMGLVTGVLVTLVFGFLPTLSAGRVRPNVVLYPTETFMPRAGRRLSLLVMVILTAIMGLLVGQILGNRSMGISIAYGTMAVLGLATLILRGLIFVLSHLPSLGSISIKLSQRAISEQAGRAASTLLALVVGMFALSLVLLLTRTVLNVINDVTRDQLGGNVIAMAGTRAADEQLQALAADLDGVKSVRHEIIYQAQVVAINGDRDVEGIVEKAHRAAKGGRAPDEGTEMDTSRDVFDPYRFRLQRFVDAFELRLAGESTKEYELAEGNNITPSSDKRLLVQESDVTKWLGLKTGDRLTLRFEGEEERTVTIAGLMAEPSEFITVSLGDEAAALGSDNVIPEGVKPIPSAYVLDVETEKVNETLVALSDIPDMLTLEVTQLNELLERLAKQLSALPLVVAVLALFASGVIIANTVSLATLERRRQVGIMKALGLRSGDVLRLLLLENGLIGLAGGLIGTGIGTVGIVLMGVLADNPGSFPYLTLVGLVLLAVVIALAATLVTAYGAAREKPLIVLRYE